MKVTYTLTAVLALATLVGCGGGAEKVGGAPVSDDWWNNPGQIRDHLGVVGSAVVIANPVKARDNARANGIAQVAATLKTRITQLVENWSKEVGDLAAGPESFTSLVNNEEITRQFTDATIAGAQAIKYKAVGKVQYVLVVLNDPGKWTENLYNELEKQALAEETLWKTEAMKADFRKKMDSLRTEQVDKANAERQRVLEAAGATGE